jgi:hypothetical protein
MLRMPFRPRGTRRIARPIRRFGPARDGASERDRLYSVASWHKGRSVSLDIKHVDGARNLAARRIASLPSPFFEGSRLHVGRYHSDLPRLWPGIYIYQRRAGLLRQPRIQRTQPLCRLPRRAQSSARWWRRWLVQQLRFVFWLVRGRRWLLRWRSSRARDVQRHVLELWPGGQSAFPAQQRKARLLLHVLSAAWWRKRRGRPRWVLEPGSLLGGAPPTAATISTTSRSHT